MRTKSLVFSLFFLATVLFSIEAHAQPNMNSYCYVPPFVIGEGASAPALVTLVAGRDHKLYYEAYNDASDLDEDGEVDVGYKHSIDYYGYFDPYKCYKYQGSGGSALFVPVRVTNDKYCGNSGEWSGNFLNWLTMSRMDVLRKVLYGGHRETDSSNETVLSGAYIPQDAHSWGKEISEIAGERSYVPNIDKLVPIGKPESGKRHLFCVVSKSDGAVPVIRVLKNKDKRIWEWTSKERPVCDNSLGTPYDYSVKVKVCDKDIGLESNCKVYKYTSGNQVYRTYKPIGLLQKYGEPKVSEKVCSKSFYPCKTDDDCKKYEGSYKDNGLCIDKSQMYFGLFTGSYTKNTSGGVLRKNIWTVLDEINSQTGIFQTSENVQGNIILTFDRMKVIGFRYSDYSYQDSSGGTCGWITDHSLNEGECRMWGNPIAEMMYEALRYLAGKSSPTSGFTYDGTQDSTINLPKPSWGINQGSTTYSVPQLFPWCAKSFMIVLSDINPSYDSDSLPGSYFGSFTGDLSDMNVQSLADEITSTETISGNYFIGQSGSQNDFVCSPKNVSSLSTIRGLCPEEPTKQGSYYSAAVSYYGRTKWNANLSDPGRPNVTTYSVALASPIPDISLKIGGKDVKITPFAKSISGCYNVYDNCSSKCTISVKNGNLTISSCQAGAFCPTNQIVDFYVDTINYDSNGNVTYAKFRINFEDVEQGADHDMDALVNYEITPVGNNQLKVKLTSDYAAGCIDQVLGFIISGTTEDGQYLVVKDKDASQDGDTPFIVANMPLTWEKTFTVSGNAAGQLKDPLWYAAKWGGFDDINGNNKPDLPEEWDKDGNGIPDTYFRVTNPLKMEEQLESVFIDILRKVSSGTTVVALPPTSTTAFSILARTYFYPSKILNNSQINWVGELATLWFDSNGLMRENTDENEENEKEKFLDIRKDLPLSFVFDYTHNAYVGMVYSSLDSEGNPTSCDDHQVKPLETIMSIFKSGEMLLTVNPNDRKIKTGIDSDNDGKITSSEVVDFTTSLNSTLKDYWNYGDLELGPCDDDCAESVIKYIRGYDKPTPSGDSFRLRQGNSSMLDNPNTWKLGDTVYSTPRIAPNAAVNGYDLRYNDSTYSAFIKNTIKNQDPLIIMGANDGMVHAFRLGKMDDILPPTYNNGGKQVTKLSSDQPVGQEVWNYIPYNAIPYLRWYCQENYCHIPTLETTFTILDASIGDPGGPQNPNADKTVASWRRLLIAQMGLGGSKITIGEGDNQKTFSSSIIVIDITDHLNPVLLWEQPLPDNTLTFATPGIVRLGDRDKNGSWYLVIGSGPTGITTTTLSYPVSPNIYVFDLKTGEMKASFSLSSVGVSNQAVGDMLSTDLDLPAGDYQVDDIYFGTYNDSQGDLWRLRIRNGSGYETDPTKWAISKVIDVGRPVFAAPAVAHDRRDVRWLYFGTGIYLTTSHANPTNEKFFGVIEPDECWKGTGTCSTVIESNLLDTTSATFGQGKAVSYVCQCPGGITVSKGSCYVDNNNQIVCPPCPSGTQVITEIRDAVLTTEATEISGCNNKTKDEAIKCIEDTIYKYDESTGKMNYYFRGWQRLLSQKKLYSSPVVTGGAVIATPFKPVDDICASGGSTYFLAVYYTTGTPYYQPIIKAEGGTTGEIDNVAVVVEVELAKGAPPTKSSVVLRQQGDKVTAVTQVSGAPISTEVTQPNPIKDKFIHWFAK
ncbi:MAG: hypothetical protein WHS38_11020 [Thermodesulforhabdaceae bacterium]